MEYFFVVVMGLLVGSFLNVCIYRIPKDESIVKPPSHCMNCQKRLSSLDLIPVFSYVFLKGCCRYCKVKISPRYMLIEILTALVFLSLYLKYQNNIVELIAYSCFMAILIVVFFIDLDEQIIPYSLVIAGIIVGIIIFIYNFYFTIDIYIDRNWWNPLVGILSGAGILFIIAIVAAKIYKTDDAMGMGDVNIFIPIGLLLGWRITLLALFASVLLSSVVAIILLATKIKSRKDGIPFGPYIVTATFIMLMYGREIWEFYMSFM
jgi:leader peptidase (prepilin peptidase)/N-methyltransferase